VQATADREGILLVATRDGKLPLIELGRRLRRRRPPRLHARVVELAQDGGDTCDLLTTARFVRTARPVPKTCPQIAGPSSRDEKAILKTLTQAVCRTALRAAFTEHLGSTEVLRGVGRWADFQALCARGGELWQPTRETERCSARTVDPLLTMELRRQLVATHGNGFRLLSPFRPSLDLPLIAIGCNHAGAP
jgi:hypothetical protein